MKYPAPRPEPNKPMVRTATTALAEPELPSWRRHIGQPLGKQVAGFVSIAEATGE